MKYHWISRPVVAVFFSCVRASANLFPLKLRAGVLHAPPFAIVDDDGTSFSGFQPDLLDRLRIFAMEDNIELNFILERSTPQYGSALNLVASDCNTTGNPNLREDCNKYDLIVGDYYCNPARSVRVDFTPSWLRTTMSSVKFIDKVGQDYTTLTQVSQARGTTCVPDGTYLMSVVMEKFQDANYIKCASPEECLDELKAENCSLYVDDELQLRYRAAHDAQLEVTREQFNTQYIVWPVSYKLERKTMLLLKKWLYAAVSNATLDELYFKYFQRELCPIGTAGDNCELSCDPDHGESDAQGVCMCLSTRWTGPDCSVEVMENTNAIPLSLLVVGYFMFGINASIVAACAGWLWIKRKSAEVRAAQPFFLAMVLLGCLISSSTIVALSQQDRGYGKVTACTAIPWLYSAGFSFTFGTLFAKIRRVYLIFKSAVGLQRTTVTIKETLRLIGCVLLLDFGVLIVWTIVDPMEWRRHILSADLFGYPLESEGYCASNHWKIFSAIIGTLHVSLLIVASYMCYVAQSIPTTLSEGRYVAMAMVSNLQVFVVGVPVIILLGSDSGTGYFIRCAIIWMNDLVVVVLIFGHLIYAVHFASKNDKSLRSKIHRSMNAFSTKSSKPFVLSEPNYMDSMGSAQFSCAAESSVKSSGTDL